MKDKLAEEIIKQFVVEVEGLDGIEYVSHELAIHCMQAYHEAKMRDFIAELTRLKAKIQQVETAA